MRCSQLSARVSTTRSHWRGLARRWFLVSFYFTALTTSALAARPPLEIPARDEAELKLIKQAPALTSPELVQQDVVQMIAALRAKLDDDDKDDADRVLKAFAHNQPALNNAAAIAWVQNCPGTALLLAAEAARIDVKNTNAVNTLAALLVQAGYAHKGIPLLEHLAGRFPNDPTILNNLGQAWFDVGEKDKAKQLFGRCLALAPAHGAAHASLGVISQAEGKTAEATAHFKTAAEANSSPAACYELDRSHTDSATPPGFLRLTRSHEYFNPHHFIPPAAQKDINQFKEKQAELDAFQRLVSTQLEIASKLAAVAAIEGQQELLKQMMSGGAAGGGGQYDYSHLDSKRLEQPIHDFISRCAKIPKDAEKLSSDLAFLSAEERSKMSEPAQQWSDTYGEKFGEGMPDAPAALAAWKQVCVTQRGIAQTYLNMKTQCYQNFVDQNLPPLRVAVNDALNCLPFALPAPMVKSQFYGLVTTYLQSVAVVAGWMPVEGPPCEVLPAGKGGDRTDELPNPGNCPFNLKINLHVAKLKADCKSMSFEFEAGLEFKAKKDFRSGETTFTGGVGADIGAANVEGGFVVTWNKDNNLSYVGMQVGASAKLSGIPGLSGSLDTSSIASGTSVTASSGGGTPDIVNVSATSTLGVTLGPNGVEPQIGGSAAADVLGQSLFETHL